MGALHAVSVQEQGKAGGLELFFLKIEQTEQNRSCGEGIDTRVGSLRLGTCTHGADVFMAMQARVSAHFNCINLGKLIHSAIAVSFFFFSVFNVIPLLVGTDDKLG